MVEPWTSAYVVLRLKRRVEDDATIGLLATATNRFEPADPPAPPDPRRARRPAGRRPLHQRRLRRECRRPLALRPRQLRRVRQDSRRRSGGRRATGGRHHPRDAVSRAARRSYLDKVGGAHWPGTAYYYYRAGARFNDLGYLERKNDLPALTLTYRTIEPWWNTVETQDQPAG